MFDSFLECAYSDEITGSHFKHRLDLNDLHLPPGHGPTAAALIANNWLGEKGIQSSDVQVMTENGWDDDICMTWQELFHLILLQTASIPEGWYRQDKLHADLRWIRVSSVLHEDLEPHVHHSSKGGHDSADPSPDPEVRMLN